MWNFVKRLLTSKQPFRICKRMAALAAGKASIPTIFFGPTCGYRILDFIFRPLFAFNNIVVRMCFAFGPLVLILYMYIDAKTFNEYAEGAYALTTIAVNSGICINIHVRRPLMLIMIRKFEDVIESRLKNEELIEHYSKACEFVEEWTLIILLLFVVMTLGCTTGPYFLLSYFLYITTDRKESAFHLPFPAWLPWNWRTPEGYFIAFCIEFAPIFYITLFCALNMSLHVGTCRLLVALVDDVKAQWKALDDNNSNKCKKAETLGKFCKCVELHTTAKEFPADLSEIFEFYYTLHFFWTLLTICISLLMLQTELLEEHPDESSLLRLVVLTFWSFAQIFVYCDSSDRVDGEFEDIDVYSNSRWYMFPDKIQRMLPLFIGTAQQPLSFAGFGGATCTRESFKNVANTGFSYFTVMRTFRT